MLRGILENIGYIMGNFISLPGVKKSHFGNFSDRASLALPCYYDPQESLAEFTVVIR